MGESEWRTDGQVVAEAFLRLEGSLLRCAARNTWNHESARDVVQETFLRLWTADPSEIKGHERQWLLSVCRNRALDVRKKESRMISMSQTSAEIRARIEESEDARPTPQAQLEAQEKTEHVKSATDALPENQQLVIHLKFDDELTYRQIATLTNLTVNSVHSLLNRARRTFRQKLGVDTDHLKRRKKRQKVEMSKAELWRIADC